MTQAFVGNDDLIRIERAKLAFKYLCLYPTQYAQMNLIRPLMLE